MLFTNARSSRSSSRLDQVELVHRDELQDLGAKFSVGIARQGLHHLDIFRRFWTVGRREIATQLRFERGPVGLDKGIKPDAVRRSAKATMAVSRTSGFS